MLEHMSYSDCYPVGQSSQEGNQQREAELRQAETIDRLLIVSLHPATPKATLALYIPVIKLKCPSLK
jgi:hypothetical protein